MAHKLDLKLFRSIKEYVKGGATNAASIKKFGISETTLLRVKRVRSFAGYKRLIELSNREPMRGLSIDTMDEVYAPTRPIFAGQPTPAKKPWWAFWLR
jgi:hypothetical protein